MSPLLAALLGVVEGITEFLPISSTGHLILVQDLLGIPSTEAVKSFDIVIQSGAIAAAIVMYWKSLQNRKVWLPVLTAFVPTVVLGTLLHSAVKEYLLSNVTVVIAALAIGGVLLILVEKYAVRKPAIVIGVDAISLPKAALIGCVQVLAVIPGTSRSAATILGGMLLGVDRKTIVDFSFLLAVPTMLGATALDLMKSAHTFSSSDTVAITIGFVVSFITALAAIRWLLSFIKTHTFVPFGIYRILLSLVLFWFIL